MASKRTTRDVVLDAEPAAPPSGGTAVVTAAPPPAPQIGQACDPFSAGWLMGLGKGPETPAQHATRLGASAGKFNDAGFIAGTLSARVNWPAPPVEAVPEVHATAEITLRINPDAAGAAMVDWFGGTPDLTTGTHTVAFRMNQNTDAADMAGAVMWFNNNGNVGHVKVGGADMTVQAMRQALHDDTVFNATVDATNAAHPDLLLTAV